MATCAFAIIHNKDKILLVCIAPPFAEAYKWNFPGGVIEDDEDIRDGLVREVVEETGIVCRIDEIVDAFNTTNPDNEINIFNAVYEKGHITIQEEEILEARWVTLNEAARLPLAFNIKDYINTLQAS